MAGRSTHPCTAAYAGCCRLGLDAYPLRALVACYAGAPRWFGRSALRSPVRLASMHVLRSLFLNYLCLCMLCGVGFFFIFLCSLWFINIHH